MLLAEPFLRALWLRKCRLAEGLTNSAFYWQSGTAQPREGACAAPCACVPADVQWAAAQAAHTCRPDPHGCLGAAIQISALVFHHHRPCGLWPQTMPLHNTHPSFIPPASHGAQVAWCTGRMVHRSHGAQVAWCTGRMVHRSHGAQHAPQLHTPSVAWSTGPQILACSPQASLHPQRIARIHIISATAHHAHLAIVHLVPALAKESSLRHLLPAKGIRGLLQRGGPGHRRLQLKGLAFRKPTDCGSCCTSRLCSWLWDRSRNMRVGSPATPSTCRASVLQGMSQGSASTVHHLHRNPCAPGGASTVHLWHCKPCAPGGASTC